MKLGIWTPLPHVMQPEPTIETALQELTTKGVGEKVDRSFAFALAAVRRAEELGFEITLIAERLVAPDLECWVAASAIAAHTSKIQIMTAAHPGIYTPQIIAKMGASLDRLSGGRFALNVVPGRRAEEFALFGNGEQPFLSDAARRYRRMDEFISVIRALWGEEDCSFEGEFYALNHARLATKTVRTPAPPIYAASGSDAGKEIVARQCDAWFVSHESGLAAYESNVRRIAADIEDMRERSARFGRSLSFGISTHVICRSTAESALAEARELESNPTANVAAKALGAGLVGTPDIVLERIERYRKCGVDCLMLQFHPMLDGLEAFAAELMPHLR
jgi:dimethylsulfone monooxygenase